jgi:hypothetical protein
MRSLKMGLSEKAYLTGNNGCGDNGSYFDVVVVSRLRMCIWCRLRSVAYVGGDGCCQHT